MTAVAPQTGITNWTIDPVHSSLEFAVKHLMISTVKGRFSAVTGAVTINKDNPTSSTADVTIEAASIDTRNEQRDNHLRSADFFDVAKFPNLHFKARRVEGNLDGDFKLIGDLTIRDVTKEVTLDASAEGEGGDPWGGYRAAFSAKGKIDRKQWGLVWNQLLEAGGVAVSDEVKLTIDVQLVKAK